MARTWWWVAAAVAVSACRFDGASGLGPAIACETDVQCPGGLVCQSTARRCVKPDALDTVVPSISQSTVSIRPRADNALDTPTSMGPRADTHIALVVSEALSGAPTVTALALGAVDARVTCQLASEAAPAFDYTCSVVPAPTGPDALITWQVELSDVALNTSTVLLSQTTQLDLTAPETPLAVDAGIEVRESPWGDEQTALQPSTRIVSQPGVAPEAVRVAFRRGTAELGSTPVDAQGSFADFEVLRALGDSFIEVQAIDAAGNESAWAPIHDFIWVATFNNKIAGRLFPNPHRFEVTRAPAEGIEGHDVTERGAVDGIAFADAKRVDVEGAGSWRRLELTRGPEGRGGLPGTAFDPLRSRVVRFGGWEPGGIFGSTVAEWSGLDWTPRVASDPEGDGNPTGRYQNAMAWDSKQRGIVMYGGNSDTPLNDTWLWNGVSWKRLPDGPGARTAAMLYFDEKEDAIILYGGYDTNGVKLLDAWRLESDRWVPAAAPPIGPRLGAAVCAEPFTATVFVFGGADATSMSPPFWQNYHGQWVPVAAAGPSPRVSASCAWDSERNVLVVVGGQLTDGGSSDEVWEYDKNAWANRTPTAGSSPGPRAQHRLIYDPAREMMLLFGTDIGETDADTTWRWSGTEWSIAYRPTPAPSYAVTTNLVFDPQAAAMRTLAYDPAVGIEDAYLSAQGWRSGLTTPLPVGATRMVYDTTHQRCLMVTGSVAAPTASIWHSQSDGGWLMINADAGFNAATLLDAAPTASGLDVVTQSPAGSIRLTSISGASGLPGAPVTLGFGTWASAAAVASGTAVLRSDFDLRMYPTLSVVKNGVQGSQYVLPEPMVPNGMVADTERGTLVVPGGTRVGRISTETWELSFDAGWRPMPIADPDSDGQPALTPFPSLGYDAQNHVTLAIELIEGKPTTTWALSMANQRPQVVLRFSLTDLPKNLESRDAVLQITGGASGGSDGSRPGFAVSIRAPGWWATTSIVSDAPASAPSKIQVPLLVSGSAYLNVVAARLGEVDFLLQPLSPNGTGRARFVIDAAQLELRYRKP